MPSLPWIKWYASKWLGSRTRMTMSPPGAMSLLRASVPRLRRRRTHSERPCDPRPHGNGYTGGVRGGMAGSR